MRFFIAIHGYLAFIVLNATVVFGPSWWIPVMMIAGVILVRLVRKPTTLTSYQDSDS